jgi:hypothetical protein
MGAFQALDPGSNPGARSKTFNMKQTTQKILTEFFNSDIQTMSRTEPDLKFRTEIHSTLISLGFTEVRESLDQRHRVTYLFRNNAMLFDLQLTVYVFGQTISLKKDFKDTLLSFDQLKLIKRLKKDLLDLINDPKVSSDRDTLTSILARLEQIV